MLITQEAAKMDLVNHLSGIQMIIESAIKKYDTEIIPSHKAIFDASTRSHITNEFMRFEAVSYAQKNNLETVITNRMFLLIIPSQNGRYAVRFKKLDRYGFSKVNSSTKCNAVKKTCRRNKPMPFTRSVV